MSVASKLQLKPTHTVAVLHRPADVDLQLHGPSDTPAAEADAVIVFVRDHAALDTGAEAAVQAARRDALAWIAYPKAGKLGTDLNRDSLAAAVTGQGVRPVRQIAIDETWSALRFRPA